MYYYICDPGSMNQSAFEKQISRLQALLAEFRVNGEIGRITPLRSMDELLNDASSRGCRTIIACGTDDTFNTMMAAMGSLDAIVGFIPLEEGSYLEKILGIVDMRSAVKTVAARRIVKLDVAVLNKTFFTSYAEFGLAASRLKNLNWWNSYKALSAPEQDITIKIDNSYTMDISCLGAIVTNSRPASRADNSIANPTDGFLDVLILEKMSTVQLMQYKEEIATGSFENIPNTSVIKCRKVEILQPRGLPIKISGQIYAKAPATIQIIPTYTKMIVGKDRTF